VFGELIGVLADREADLWQLGQDLYDSSFPDGARGATLVRVGSLTGAVPEGSTSSRVLVRLTGTIGAVIPADTTRFSDAEHRQVALDAARTLTGDDLVECTAVVAGPARFPVGSITVIDTPRAGLTAVTNPAIEFVVGSYTESDTEFRIRRAQSLRALGGGSVDAIRAHLLEVAGVSECVVAQNTTDTTTSDGIPPHAVAVVAVGGLDAAVAAALMATKPVGIATYGTTSVDVLDSSGRYHTIKLSRSDDLPIYVTVQVVCAGDPPADLAMQVKDALLAYGLTHYTLGAKIRATPLGTALLPDPTTGVAEVPTVIDVDHIYIGTAPNPSSSASITPTYRQRGVLDAARIVVTSVSA
jgi:hypothetical protein